MVGLRHVSGPLDAYIQRGLIQDNLRGGRPWKNWSSHTEGNATNPSLAFWIVTNEALPCHGLSPRLSADCELGRRRALAALMVSNKRKGDCQIARRLR